MARKTLNRKELRGQAEAAEKAGLTSETAAKKKAPVKRKSRSKSSTPLREKLFWGVFNQSMKRVALFEYHQKKSAEKKSEELSTSTKTPHFVKREKVPVEE